MRTKWIVKYQKINPIQTAKTEWRYVGFKDTNVPANDYFEAWLQINVLSVLLFLCQQTND